MHCARSFASTPTVLAWTCAFSSSTKSLLACLVNTLRRVAPCWLRWPAAWSPDAADYANAAEMKRLFVREAFRGVGLGRQLAEATLDAARQAGYACVLLDTLSDMEAARALYTDLGFVEIPAYYHNPIAGAHYLKVDL